jgi:hypothetical protein
MAKRNVIRQVEAPGVVEFDDQLWPINCALLVLAGFAAGNIIATSDFDTPHPLMNGWVRLATLGLVLVGLLLGTLYLKRKRAVRRMQLAVLLSLLLHLWLGMGLRLGYLAIRPQQDEEPSEWVDDSQLVTLPDYGREPTNQLTDQESLTDPVETQTPDNPTEPAQRQQESEQPTAPTTTETAPAEQPRADPTRAQMERAEQSAPRQSDQLAGRTISRQPIRGAQAPSETVAVPEATRQAAAPSPVDASQQRPERTRTAPEPARAQVAETSPAATSPTRAARVARQSREDQPTTDVAADVPARAMADAPAIAPATELAAESATAQAAAPAAELQPAEAPAARRQAAAAPRADAGAEAPMVAATTAPATAVQARRSDAAPDAPTATAARASAVARSQAAAPSSSTADSPQLAEASMGGEATPSLDEPTSGAAARQEAASAPDAAAAGASAGEPPSAAATRVTTAGSRAAATGADEPTTGASGGAAVARASTSPAMAGSGEAIELAQATTAAGGPAGGPAETNPAGGTARAAAPVITATGGASGAAAAAGDAPEVTGTLGRRAAAGSAAADGPSMNAGSSGTIARAPTGLGQTDGEPAAEPVEVAAASGDGSAAGGIEATDQAGRSGAAAGPAAVAGAAGQVEPGGADPAAVAGAAGSSRATGEDAPQLAGADSSGQAIGRAARSAATGLGEVEVADAGPVSGDESGEATLAESNAGGGASRGEAAAPSAQLAGSSTGPASTATPGVGRAAGSSAARHDDTGPEVGAASTQGGPGRSTSVAAVGEAPIEGLEELAAGTAGAAPGAMESVATGTARRASPAAATLADGGSTAAAPATATPGAARSLAGRAPAAAEDAGPTPGNVAEGNPLAKAGGGSLDGLEALVDDIGPMAAGEEGAVASLDGAGGTGDTRRPAPAPAVDLAALTGPGGLSQQPHPEPGLPNRLARAESEVVTVSSGRFILKKSGGAAALAIEAVEPAEAFRQRMLEERGRTARSRGGSEGSERAVEMGLDWLARHQSADGHWSLHDFAAGHEEPEYRDAFPGQMQADTASTGMALLAFLGAGYTHREGKYRDVVEGGLAWLIAHQKEDGDLHAGGSKYVWLYSHGIAAIALCEAYGMTRDPAVRDPAQRALDFIAAAQHPTQGGWRYAPQTGSDTSVSGWQMMALKSGELAGLEVASSCYPLVTRWLDHAQASGDPSRYAYRPGAEHRHQREPSRTMTAEALLMRLYLGWNRDNASLSAGADFLRQNLPEVGTRQTPLRDAYYWYYATQVMYQVGGERWEAWNGRLRELLVTSQEQSGPLAGSWNPKGTVPDRWGAEAGRLYTTCMHLLMLEVYYRHLPLYQTLEGSTVDAAR